MGRPPQVWMTVGAALPRASTSLQKNPLCRGFYSTAHDLGYSDSVGNLKIGKHTKVIIQGFTGRQVRGLVFQYNGDNSGS